MNHYEYYCRENIKSGQFMIRIIVSIICCILVFSSITNGETSQTTPYDKSGMNDGEYKLYQDIMLSDIIVYGTLYDSKSSLNNGNIETSSKLYIKNILKPGNESNVSSGMTIDVFVLGGTVDNLTDCIVGEGCPRPGQGPYEGVFLIKHWDLSEKGRFFILPATPPPLDILKQAIFNTESGLPVKIPDMSLATQLEREKGKNGIGSETSTSLITSIFSNLLLLEQKHR